ADVVRSDTAQPTCRGARREDQGGRDRRENGEGGGEDDRPASPHRHRDRGFERIGWRRLAARRRKLCGQPGCIDLVQANGALDVFEAHVTEVLQTGGEILLLVLEQALRRLRDQYLAPMAGRADAGGTVDGEPGVVTAGRRRLPRVDPYSHLDGGA